MNCPRGSQARAREASALPFAGFTKRPGACMVAGSAAREFLILAILVGLHHVTSYAYDRPIHWGRSRSGCGRPRIAAPRSPRYSLKVTPAEHFVNWQQDPHGNWLARFVFPEKVDRVQDRGRSHRRARGHQPVRLLRRALCRDVSVRLRRGAEGRARRLSRARARRAAARRLHARDRAATKAARSTFSSSSTPTCSSAVHYVIRMEPGVQKPDETLALQSRLLPRLGLAAGADPAPARPRRALRLRLPDPAQGRRRSARRAEGHGQGFHRPARLGRGLSARRRLDRHGRHLGPVLRRGPPAALRHAALPLGGADHRRGRAGAR